MSDIMDLLLTEAPITGEVGVKVQLVHQGVENPGVQIIRFKNELGDIVTGNFIPSQGQSISGLQSNTTATLRGCDFMEDIQDVTLEGVNGILHLDKGEAYNLKIGDTFTAHITGKTTYSEKSMNVRIIIMLPKGEKCLEGTFVVDKDMPHNPFQSKNSSKFTITGKQDSLSYKSTLEGKDGFGIDVDVQGYFKLDNISGK